ncbi:MAG: hypothetical protein P9M14_13565 [Candidatus Alcyoniella australis]|nr:hypothetical protein [Candidatus Alcyoniella australis]
MNTRISDDDIARRLECMERKLDRIRTQDLPGLRIAIATLKVRASLWGGLAGLVPALIAVIVLLLRLLS